MVASTRSICNLTTNTIPSLSLAAITAWMLLFKAHFMILLMSPFCVVFIYNPLPDAADLGAKNESHYIIDILHYV